MKRLLFVEAAGVDILAVESSIVAANILERGNAKKNNEEKVLIEASGR